MGVRTQAFYRLAVSYGSSDRWLVVADQRALFKGSPEEKPEAHAKSSPITYVDDVAAPLLVIQGSNDTRCPPRPMQAYLLRGTFTHPMTIPITTQLWV